MNIVEKLYEMGLEVGLEYYGPNDMATNIYVKQFLDNKEIIQSYFENQKFDDLNDYIDYIFLDMVLKYKEVVDLIIEEKREEFRDFIIKMESVYPYYSIGKVIDFINRKHEDIFNYIDENKFHFIEASMKEFTTSFIAYYFSAFKNEIIERIILDRSYEVIDNYKYWEKYFDCNPQKLLLLFNEENIEQFYALRLNEMSAILTKLNDKPKFKKIIEVCSNLIYLVYKRINLNQSSANQVWIDYYETYDCLQFFRKIRSRHAYELEQIFKEIEQKFTTDLSDNGEHFGIIYDLKEKLDVINNSEIDLHLRMLEITHSLNNEENNVDYIEVGLSNDIEPISMKFSKPAPNTNNDFSQAKLLSLNISSYEVKSLLNNALTNTKSFKEYILNQLNTVKLICEKTNSSIYQADLIEDFSILENMLSSLFTNKDKKRTWDIYGCIMLMCGLIEKLLRTIYISTVSNDKYIPSHETSLGFLLRINNETEVIASIIGEEQIKILRYFLIKAEQEDIGKNIRNSLAHLDSNYSKYLNDDTLLEILGFLTLILNDCYLYYSDK